MKSQSKSYESNEEQIALYRYLKKQRERFASVTLVVKSGKRSESLFLKEQNERKSEFPTLFNL